MNKDFISELVRPHLNSNKELTYTEFENIFASWKHQEQYMVCEVLHDLGILLVDQKTIINDENKNNKNISKNAKKEIIITKSDLDNITNNIQKESTKIRIDTSENCDERLAILYKRTGHDYYIEKLIKKHFGFIKQRVNIIRKHYNCNFEDEELIQIAKMGFMEGCKRFDINKGNKLLSYVGWWIDQRLNREIKNHGFLVRLPEHIWEKLRKITKFSKSDNIHDIEYFLKNENISEAKYDELIQYQHKYLNPASLDEKIANCENVELIDTISQDVHCFLSRYKEADKIIEEKDLKNLICSILNQLSTKEKDVMVLRYGLDDNSKKNTLEEIGQRYGVSRERIRQIEKRAKAKILKILRKKINSNNEIIQDMKPGIPIEFDKNYFFKKNDISYIPELTEMIDRIISLNNKENDEEKLYEKFKICACQNGYNLQKINKKNILNKFKQRKDYYARNSSKIF